MSEGKAPRLKNNPWPVLYVCSYIFAPAQSQTLKKSQDGCFVKNHTKYTLLASNICKKNSSKTILSVMDCKTY